MKKKDIASFLVVSNGHGEDQIACNIITALTHRLPNATFTAIPLVGNGHHFTNIGITPALTNPIMPSGGFIRTLNDLAKDIRTGLITSFRHQHSVIQHHIPTTTVTIAVGDSYCLYRSSRKNPTPIIFLPTAKSDRFMPHSWIEKQLMRRYARQIFTRDQVTANALKNAKLPALFLGNPMMDNLTPKITLPLNPDIPTLGLLPGSRNEAYKNLILQLNVSTALSTLIPTLQIVIAKADTLDTDTLATHLMPYGWEINKQTLTHDSGTCALLSSHFNSVIHQSDAICGLSGTANEQAVYIGKTVITFPGFGPQSTEQRFKEQQQLLGKKLIYLPTNDINLIAETLAKHLKHAHETPPPPIQKSAENIAESIIAHLHLS